jgi:hypothetical protein
VACRPGRRRLLCRRRRCFFHHLLLFLVVVVVVVVVVRARLAGQLGDPVVHLQQLNQALGAPLGPQAR